MKAFSIGQVVAVSKVAQAHYDLDGNRKITTFPVEPLLAVVVGQCVKRLGRYRSASSGGPDFEFEPAYLQVSGSETLWLVRTGMVNKPLLIRDEDLVPSELPYKVPRRGPRATFIFDGPTVDGTFSVPLLTHQ